SSGKDRNLEDAGSYFARDLVNNFTALNADGTLTRAIPAGGILDQLHSSSVSRNLRASLNFTKALNTRHHISSVAGWEARISNSSSGRHRLYGYDDQHASISPVDYITLFKRYSNPAATQAIPNADYETELTDRFISYYANGAYTYNS